MKNYLLLIATAITLIGLKACTTSNAQNSNALIERKDTTGCSTEWAELTAKHQQLTTALKDNPKDYDNKIKLIALYLNESRVTGNASHYNALAMQHVTTILADTTSNPEQLYFANHFKSSVLMSLHQFTNAKEYAFRASQSNPYNADSYGTLIDACVELGQYDSAVIYSDKMISIRPDLRSYSRVSYLRELYGDNTGAKQAMQMAINAGLPGSEGTEWCRVQLANLYKNSNALDSAKALYNQSLVYRPNYVYALIGLAQIEEQKNNYIGAIEHCEKAIGILSESSFISYLATLYAKNNENEKATSIHKEVVAKLETLEIENRKEKLIPHNGFREIAQAYVNADLLDKALMAAQKDLALRPNNIDANELVAQILHLQGKNNDALNYIKRALSTNRKNRVTLELAQKIYTIQGENIVSIKSALQSI